MKFHVKRLWPTIAAALVAAIVELQKTQGNDPRWAVGLAVALTLVQSLIPSAVSRKDKSGDK